MKQFKPCQKCKANRVVFIQAKAPDGFSYKIPELNMECDSQGSAPDIPNICGGDYISFDVCLECGQIQGKFPVKIEEDLPIPETKKQKEHREKLEKLRTTHPDRLLSADVNKEFQTQLLRLLTIVKEAKEKGYTILPADDPSRLRFGIVLYKEIEGTELAYNPTWKFQDKITHKMLGYNERTLGYTKTGG